MAEQVSTESVVALGFAEILAGVSTTGSVLRMVIVSEMVSDAP